jgi:CRP-like cAMP-binding protein
MQNGASAGFAIAGNEGVIGIASILGGETTPSQAVVLSAGYAYRLEADLLKGEFEHGGLLLRTLLRYTQALITQTGQMAVHNRHHPVEQQLCRWILACLDRSPSNELTMTQELIANMLGVRREGVTDAAGKLQKSGLIHCSRGHIVVLDRPQLEARVCECYAVVKREYDRLLPEYRQAELAS